MNIALYSVLSEASEGIIDRINGYAAAESQSIAQQQLADPDYWSSVGIITVTGILVVFFILAILIFLFWLMGTIFKVIDNRKKQKAEVRKADVPAVQAPPVSVETVSAAADDPGDDDEIIAVISAAIAACAEQDGTSYRIKDIKRRDGRTRSAWSLAGITENTRPF